MHHSNKWSWSAAESENSSLSFNNLDQNIFIQGQIYVTKKRTPNPWLKLWKLVQGTCIAGWHCSGNSHSHVILLVKENYCELCFVTNGVHLVFHHIITLSNYDINTHYLEYMGNTHQKEAQKTCSRRWYFMQRRPLYFSTELNVN